MKCIDNELLQRFHDGECQHEEAGNVALHLDTCPACRSNYEQLQTRVTTIKQAFDSLVQEDICIPSAMPNIPVKRTVSLHRKYIIPLLAAASILLLIMVLNRKEINNTPDAPMLQSCFTAELDANKPAEQQEFRFTVVTPDGKVQEYFIRTQ